jgi:tetratricopeptide (TPR) repeat protein
MHRPLLCFRPGWLAAVAFWGAMLLSGTSVFAADTPLEQRVWFEARTEHFKIYSCGDPTQVFKVAAQLEQFSATYSQLAGAQAVASPPIVVMAFPDHEAMVPFLPLYQGQPANLAAFFQHGSDENMIVLSLPGPNETMDMSVVFHEYTHFLLRRNDRIWPLWLKEGMAEIYSTFQVSGYTAFIAQPIEHHLRLLAQQPLMPLSELFSVTHDSPQYNESERQGIFYAESWLLTHLLFAGDNPAYRARFGNYTPLLREGRTQVGAFTGALGASLPQVDAELHRYLANGQFGNIQLTLSASVAQARRLAMRRLTPVENDFRLGDELLRINRLDEAERYFNQGKQLAPASPLPYEGLGLVALRRQNPDAALADFKQSLQLGSTSFLAHYYYAWQKFKLAEAGFDTDFPPDIAKEIHDELLKSIVHMPNFGPSHELYGILEMTQSDGQQLGEQHLQLAAQLEPENPDFQLALAQAEFYNHQIEAVRHTLASLLLPTAEPQVRVRATELMRKLDE